MLDYDITIGDGRGCHQDMQRRRNMLLLSGLSFPLSYRGQRPLELFFFLDGQSDLTTTFALLLLFLPAYPS